jgi:uridine kinase
MRPQDAAEMAAALIMKARRAGVIIVAIDGAGGAGKSTLAEGIRKKLDEVSQKISIVRVDDFYRPLHDDERAARDPGYGYRNYFDWQAIRDDALTPLRAGVGARYQPYDWMSGERRGWVEILPTPTVVLEGVYSSRPELRDLVDLAVFVDTPRATRLARMKARAQNNPTWIDRWMAAEDWYLENIRPADTADLVVAGF